MGIQLAFIATRSGFMRYADHSHLFVDPLEEEERRRKRKNKKKKKGDEEEIKEP